MGIENPNDEIKKTNLVIIHKDGTKSPDITDVWVRQDGRWINIIPPDRTYKASIRIIEKTQTKNETN